MKRNCHFSHIFVLFAVLIPSDVSGSSFDYLFGIQAEAKANVFRSFVEDLNVYYREHVGSDSMARSVSPREARDQGERALNCVANIVGIDRGKWFQNPFLWDFIYERYYEAFESQDAIDGVCNYTKFRDNPNRHLQEETLTTTTHGDVSHVRHRALETAAEPQYPAAISTRYANWARERVRSFIRAEVDGERDLTARTDFVVYIREGFVPFEDLDIAQRTFGAFRATFNVICRIFGSVEIPIIPPIVFVDPGDMCNVITESFDLVQQTTILGLQSIAADRVTNDVHDSYIDSAEIQAIFTNVEILVNNTQ